MSFMIPTRFREDFDPGVPRERPSPDEYRGFAEEMRESIRREAERRERMLDDGCYGEDGER